MPVRPWRKALTCAAVALLWAAPELFAADPEARFLGSLQEEISGIVAARRASIVRVLSHHDGGVAGAGADSGTTVLRSRIASGVVWDSHHVVTYDPALPEAQRIEILLEGGGRAASERVGSDPLTGLTVLHTSTPLAPPMPRDGNGQVQAGELVLVMGNAFGSGTSVALGLVSGGARRVRDRLGRSRELLQLTAPANPGDAGGAVLDVKGRLVGFVIGKPPGRESNDVTLAVPYHDGRRGVERLVAGGGGAGDTYLGVTVEDPPPGVSGVTVARVVKGSPAARAGLRVGDRIIQVNGARLPSVDSLLRSVVYSPVGARLQLAAEREGELLDLEAVLGSKADVPLEHFHEALGLPEDLELDVAGAVEPPGAFRARIRAGAQVSRSSGARPARARSAEIEAEAQQLEVRLGELEMELEAVREALRQCGMPEP